MQIMGKKLYDANGAHGILTMVNALNTNRAVHRFRKGRKYTVTMSSQIEQESLIFLEGPRVTIPGFRGYTQSKCNRMTWTTNGRTKKFSISFKMLDESVPLKIHAVVAVEHGQAYHLTHEIYPYSDKAHGSMFRSVSHHNHLARRAPHHDKEIKPHSTATAMLEPKEPYDHFDPVIGSLLPSATHLHTDEVVEPLIKTDTTIDEPHMDEITHIHHIVKPLNIPHPEPTVRPNITVAVTPPVEPKYCFWFWGCKNAGVSSVPYLTTILVVIVATSI